MGAPRDRMGGPGRGAGREWGQQLPMEFAVEAQKLVSISLEGSVG